MKKNHNTYYERTNPIETCTKGRSKHLMKLLYLFAICCIIFLQIAASAFIQKNCWWRSELIRPFTNEPHMIERNNISKNFSQFNIRRKEKKRELFFPNFTSISFSPLCDMKRKKFEDRTTPFPSKRKDWSPDCTLWFTIFLPSRMRFKRDWSWNDSKKILSDFCQKNSYFAKMLSNMTTPRASEANDHGSLVCTEAISHELGYSAQRLTRRLLRCSISPPWAKQKWAGRANLNVARLYSRLFRHHQLSPQCEWSDVSHLFQNIQIVNKSTRSSTQNDVFDKSITFV